MTFPQGDGEAQTEKPGEEVIEPEGILQGEKASEDILGGIVEVEGCLEADTGSGKLGEGDHRFFELVLFGNVLGIVNGQELSPSKGKAKVAGSRLGLWLTPGDEDETDVVGGMSLFARL